jgi:hypothetical protein
MSGDIKKIKQQSSGPDFWQLPGGPGQTRKELKIEAAAQAKYIVEPPGDFIGSDSSIRENEKLKLVYITGSSRKETKEQVLPNNIGWNVADGDYQRNSVMTDERTVHYRLVKKRLQKIYFAVALLVVAVIVIAIASIVASSISL